MLVKPVQFSQSRGGKEIPVKEKIGTAKGSGGGVTVADHLEDMGRSIPAGPVPGGDVSQAVLDVHIKRETEHGWAGANDGTDTAIHVTEDIFRFRRIIRFLEKPFYTGHEIAFFWVFGAVADEQGPATQFIKRGVPKDEAVPGFFEGKS